MNNIIEQWYYSDINRYLYHHSKALVLSHSNLMSDDDNHESESFFDTYGNLSGIRYTWLGRCEQKYIDLDKNINAITPKFLNDIIQKHYEREITLKAERDYYTSMIHPSTSCRHFIDN